MLEENKDASTTLGASKLHTNCLRCKRPLKTLESKMVGYGPICAAKSGIKHTAGERYGQLTMHPSATIADDETGDIIIKTVDGNVVTNVDHVWKYHSPTGFAYGYGGSGPADLALNILLKVGCDRDQAFELHQDFKWKFIAVLPQEGGRITRKTIADWINDQKENKDVL